MPGYRGHLVGGVVAFGVAHAAIKMVSPQMVSTFQDAAIGFSICLLGSLFPDIDIKSVGQRIFYIVALVLAVFAVVTHQSSLLGVLCVLSIFPLVVSHRGVIHRLWFIILVPLIVPLALSYGNAKLLAPAFVLYVYFVSGAFSHLLLDYGVRRLFRR